jgi:ATP-dependent RNA helicase RhlE
MHDAVTVEVARRNMPIELIGQVVHPVDKERKRHLLAHLVKLNDWQQVLVFTRTKHGANRLAEQLEQDGIEASAIHGNKSQPQRTKALKRFKDCELQVLVATDIAARGIDIEALPHVVNYDLPHVPEDYVHRIGRTGRAGESGQAVSLVSNEDRSLLRDIEKLINRTIDQQVVPGFEPSADYYTTVSPEPQQRRGERTRNEPRRRTTPGNAPRRAGTSGSANRRPGSSSSANRRPESPNSGPRRPGMSSGGPARSASSSDPQRRPQNSRRGAQPSKPLPGREQGRRQQQPSLLLMPFDREQQSVLRDQLEHHRRQQAEERGETPSAEPKREEPRARTGRPPRRMKGRP